MRVLIVQSKPELGTLWRRHLERLDATVTVVETGDAALILLQDQYFDVIVLDLVLREGSALTVADFANFNQPRAFVETKTPPSDLAAIVHHYGQSVDRDTRP